MKTAVMTDTNSALTAADGKRFGIYVLPMPVIIDDTCYSEGLDISYDQVFDALLQDRELHTSMPSLGDITDMWDRILGEDGYDELVYLPMSSGLSGSCMAAAAAAADYDGKVQVVDNHRISYTLMNAAFDAKEMAEGGMCAADIKEELERSALDSSIYITVNTLKHLVKSGRVTATGARIANLLQLKPVLQIQGDKLDAFAKAHGMQAARLKMIQAVKHDIETRFADVPAERLSIGTAGTLRDPEECERWRKQVEEAFPGSTVYYRPLSCSIACHIGVDAIGAAVTVIRYDQDKYHF